MPATTLALHRRTGLHAGGGLVRHRHSQPSVLERLHQHAARAKRQLTRTGTDETGAEAEPFVDPELKTRLVEMGLVTATGFASGVIQGRFGRDAFKVGKVPMDLPIGAGLVAAGLLLPLGRLRLPMRAVGLGLLVGHGSTWGRGTGKWMRARSNEPPLIEGDGAPRRTGGAALSDEELASVANRT
jgi:hypothetical protein